MKTAILSFDVEEFDMPFEFGGHSSLQEQIATSSAGLQSLVTILNRFNASATFYCTGIYALAEPDNIRSLSVAHEVASHNYYHSSHKTDDLRNSKLVLENITQKEVKGFRMPRMAPVSDADLLEAGYSYNASYNPTYLPGRYDYRHIPRTIHQQNGLIHVPASVSPRLRLPLFWIAFHNYPLSYFFHLCKKVAEADGYLHLYFHPWEFTDYTNMPDGAKYPFYLRRNNGLKMQKRFNRLLNFLKQEGFAFKTTSWLLEQTSLFAEPI
ncbi:polysaccharide deacetylase family protein [Emticicia fluvialis]|uniref:polysaccharide deacetylase family protein n=1 Tax=Emticicia fluvialis TaxID=2974474 RepID=UPI00216525FE|nr:polysaccharide deacetylase family protein [Emticicia fluvialis]